MDAFSGGADLLDLLPEGPGGCVPSPVTFIHLLANSDVLSDCRLGSWGSVLQRLVVGTWSLLTHLEVS